MRYSVLLLTVLIAGLGLCANAKHGHKRYVNQQPLENHISAHGKLRAVGAIGVAEGIAHVIGTFAKKGVDALSAAVGGTSSEVKLPPPSVYMNQGRMINNVPPGMAPPIMGPPIMGVPMMGVPMARSAGMVPLRMSPPRMGPPRMGPPVKMG